MWEPIQICRVDMKVIFFLKVILNKIFETQQMQKEAFSELPFLNKGRIF